MLKYRSITHVFLVVCLVLTTLLSVVHAKCAYVDEEATTIRTKSITWGTTYEKNGITYIPGQVTADFGTYSFAWKLSKGENPKLVTLQTLGSAGLPPLERKLYLLRDEAMGTTTIFEEILPLANSSKPSYLKQIAVVSSADLESGISLD